VLVDTNLLVRTLQPHHPLYAVAGGVIAALRSRNTKLYLVPQNLVELWTVATRPADVNGLGMSTAAVRSEIERLERFFTVLPETSAIYPAWKRLVIEHRVSGKPAYDARLVASMHVHGITAILTFDKAGFSRYPGIGVVHPTDITVTS
jgi:predicted nucleic acid-binding protein